MPFCTQCGNTVGDQDQFCAICGAKQGVSTSAGSKSTSAASSSHDFLRNLNPRIAAILCYIPTVGWIPAIVILSSAKFREDRDTRFHAFQGLYLFVAWLIVDWVLKPLAEEGWVVGFHPVIVACKAVILIAWIWMIIKVSQNEFFKLPILGELAERSVTEQR